MPTIKTSKAAEIEASFIAGLEQLAATAKAGGVKALKAKHARPLNLEAALELPAITGDDVLAARESLGVNRAVFAKILGVTAPVVDAWETGAKPATGAARRLIAEIRDTPEYWRQRFGLVVASRAT